MLAIAIAALFLTLAAVAGWTIVTSVRQGLAIGRGIMAELATLQQGEAQAVATFRPLRGRSVISQQGYSRQPVRLRPMRRACAAA
jgi:hypothetical protein